MDNKNEHKFSFDPSFQKEILQFAVTDSKNGFKVVELFESHYFTLVEHTIIAEVLKRYYGKRYSIPSQPVFKEELRQLLTRKQYKDLITKEDRAKVLRITRAIYKKPVKDPDTIYDACKKFAQFSSLKETLETIDIFDYNTYADISQRIHKAINLGTELKEDKGVFLLSEGKERILKRQDSPPGKPTPWWQLNERLNSGGTNKGNIIVLLGPAKGFKTGFMLNTGFGYLKKGGVVLYADMENGQDAISLRADQGIINVDRKTLILGGQEIDKKLLKKLRLYKRFKGEFIIKRFSAGSTTSEISRYITWVRENYGLVVTDLVCDYPDIMDTNNTTNNDVDKISRVYIDLKNLAVEHNLDTIWCPSHVNREGEKQNGNKYKATDTSKSIDKVRHADLIMGIHQSEEEKEAGIMRVEIVSQRDGDPDGTIYFKASLATQRIKELSRSEVKAIEQIKSDNQNDGRGKPQGTPIKMDSSDI